MAVDRSRRARAARKRKRRMDGVEHDLTAAEWTALTEAPTGEGPVGDVWTSAEYVRGLLAATASPAETAGRAPV